MGGRVALRTGARGAAPVVSEDAIHRAIVEAWSYAGNGVLIHVPSQGERTRRFGGHLKALGWRPGIADLLILHHGRAYAMEVKSAKGTQSDAQSLFQADCVDQGIPYAVVRSVDEAMAQFREWGVA